MTKVEVEKLFDDMVAKSNGQRKKLPNKIDPSLTKKNKGKFKPIEFVEVPNSELENIKGDCWVCVSHHRSTSGHIIYQTRDSLGEPYGSSLHRIVFELAKKKKLPKELFACHACDVPFCINPAHIFPGTAQDNTDDRVAKNRPGPEKLTLKDVWDIRLRHRLGGVKLKELAEEYSVKQETVSSVVNFKTWKGR